MDTTEGSSTEREVDPEEQLTLTVVMHPQAEMIGTRLVVRPGENLVLGRELRELESTDDRRLSRQHARVERRGDALWIEDVGSRNGTLVDGRRLEGGAEVSSGSTLAVGSLVLLVHRAPVLFRSPANDRFAGVGATRAHLLAQVAVASRTRGAALLWGETGTGKSLLAEELHLASSRAGRYVVARCAVLAQDEALEQLFGRGDEPGLLEAADGGTLVLEGIDDAPPALTAAIASYLESREVRRLGSRAGRPADVSILLTSRSDPPALFAQRSDLAARVGAFAIEVPPLRARREDILPILLHRLGWPEVAEFQLAPELCDALVRAPLLGNVHELESFAMRLAVEAEPGVIGLTPWIQAALRTGATTVEPPRREPSVGATRIARSGAWFELPSGSRVGLENRKNLQALLAALARSAEAPEKKPLTVGDLFGAGWPGERALPQAAASRVYVAMATLRRMGLRGVVGRTHDGYHLESGFELAG